MYDIFYIGENQSLKDNFPFARKVDDIDLKKISKISKTKLFFIVENNIEVTDYEVFRYVPSHYTENFIHKWKWDSNNYGGVSLYPTNYENTDTSYINEIVCKKSFDILYQAEPKDYFNNNNLSSHVWCVDPEYKLNNDINWAPGNFEPDFIHSFHLRGQLEHKYPAQEGGIKLFPREWLTANTKYHSYLDASVEYPVIFVKDINDYSQRNTFKEDYVWLVDSKHKVNLKTFDWVPSPFDDDMIHTFRMPYQLTETYPLAMGGVRLVPQKWESAETKIHPACPIEDEQYDVFYIDEDEFTSETYSEYAERSKTEWFWIVDREFDFNGKLLFVPAEYEQEYIHVFKIPGYLEERYPADFEDPWDNRCGGIRLVHKDFDITKHKYQNNICPIRYDVFYTNNLGDYETYARKSRTKMFWLIDDEHEVDNVFNYIPHRYDQKTIHIFKIPNQLTHKYPKAVTNVSDNRCGGVKLVPVKYDVDNIKYIDHSPTGYKQYPILYVEDTSDYNIVTQDCWIIDKEYQFDDEVDWTPPDFQKNMIHTFHLSNQLKHKYPEKMGGIRWVPKLWKDAEIVIHNIAPFKDLDFEKFTNEDEGREKCKNNWFWVIDPDVDVVEDFDFDFVPDTWDEGKQHVWQKLNPITGKQYDYGGVSLCPKEPQTKGRPKYIRKICSTQKEYPVYTMTSKDVKDGVAEFYKKCAEKTQTKMFWVVDYCVQICESFDFSYYPTQWDIKNVHVWQNENGDHTDVRLCPTALFLDNSFTEKEIVNNTFDDLKLMPKQASEMPEWNVYTFNNTPLKQQLIDFAEQDNNAYFWTVDSNVDTYDNWNAKFKPSVENADKLHVWQKLNPRTGKVHAYGGVRLWPNPLLDVFKTSYSSDDIKYSKTSRGKLQYVKDALSVSKPYDIVFLSYKEAGSTTAYERLTARFDATWVKDIKGIFNAHKEAANRVKSDMFWVVDADADISEDFDFSYIPDVYDEEVVHVWASKNPVTGEEYGYGGVKLFNRQQILDATSWGLDFTTGLSKRFKAMPEISCTTRFNTDAFSTWRSAFRECVKLTLSNDPDSEKRLESWLHPIPDADFRHDAKRGAEEGKAFALANKDNLEQLNNINDYDWLNEQYNKSK